MALGLVYKSLRSIKALPLMALLNPWVFVCGGAGVVVAMMNHDNSVTL
jgi:hypothetical protein